MNASDAYLAGLEAGIEKAAGILPGLGGSPLAGVSNLTKSVIGKGPTAPRQPKLDAPSMGTGGKPKYQKMPVQPPTGVTPPTPSQSTMKSM